MILGIFLISLISAFPICVDKTPPSAPSNLAITSSGHSIILTWNPAIDIPECSGIDYYVVSRNGNHIAEHVSALTYIDINVPYGSYNYTVYAVDKVAHLGGQAIKNDVILSKPTNNGGGTRVGGGGGATSYICYEEWQCGDWSSCINEKQTRTCTDLAQCGTTDYKPITSRVCSVEEVSTNPAQTTTPAAGGGITGAVIGALGSPTGIGIIVVLVVLIIGAGIFINNYSKRRK